jgi:hypothetical protein
VFVRIRDGLRAGAPAADSDRWVAEAFRIVTTNSDTHPCLTERLRALNIPADRATALASATVATPAADALLGAALETVRADVQARWCRDVDVLWQERHARASALSDRLASLEQAVPDTQGDVDGLWDKAAVLLNLRSDREVEPLLRRILALRPEHGPANFQLGRILLEAGNAEGETYLQRAMAEEDECVPAAGELLHDYYRRAGRNEKLRELDALLDRHEKEREASQAERREVTARDRFLPHGLSAPELEALRKILAAEPELARADLARKDLRHFPKQRLFLLSVRRRAPWHRLPSRDRDQQLVNRLTRNVRLPGRVLVFAPTGAFRAIGRKLRYVPHTEVFRRGAG